MCTCNALVADWRCDHENFRGHLEYYITSRDERRRETSRRSELWALALRHAVQSWEVERSTKLTKVEKRRETKMIRCFKKAQYQLRESKERRGSSLYCVRVQNEPSLTLSVFLSLSVSLSLSQSLSLIFISHLTKNAKRGIFSTHIYELYELKIVRKLPK